MDRRGIAISQGAACRSGAVTPSHTLQVMGLDDARATSSVRVSLGHGTQAADVSRIVRAFTESAAEVRAGL
jgi:cysteine desulfurase